MFSISFPAWTHTRHGFKTGLSPFSRPFQTSGMGIRRGKRRGKRKGKRDRRIVFSSTFIKSPWWNFIACQISRTKVFSSGVAFCDVLEEVTRTWEERGTEERGRKEGQTNYPFVGSFFIRGGRKRGRKRKEERGGKGGRRGGRRDIQIIHYFPYLPMLLTKSVKK